MTITSPVTLPGVAGTLHWYLSVRKVSVFKSLVWLDRAKWDSNPVSAALETDSQPQGHWGNFCWVTGSNSWQVLQQQRQQQLTGITTARTVTANRYYNSNDSNSWQVVQQQRQQQLTCITTGTTATADRYYNRNGSSSWQVLQQQRHQQLKGTTTATTAALTGITTATTATADR